MGILKLNKGDSVVFTQALKQVRIGANWDEQSGGLLGKAKSFMGVSDDIDVDISVVIRHNDGTHHEIVYYNHQLDNHGFIKHFGDNLTGADIKGQEDDEDISIDLTKVPSNVEKMQIIINIYSAYGRSQHFGMVDNANASIYNNETGEQLATFDLTADYKNLTGVLLGEVVNVNGQWQFVASGNGYRVADITELVRAIG